MSKCLYRAKWRASVTGRKKYLKKGQKKIPQKQCLVEWMAGVKGEQGLSHWNHWKIYKFLLDFLGIFSGDGKAWYWRQKSSNLLFFRHFVDNSSQTLTVLLSLFYCLTNYPDVFPLLNIQSGKCLDFGKFKITKSRHYIFKLSTALDSIWGL